MNLLGFVWAVGFAALSMTMLLTGTRYVFLHSVLMLLQFIGAIYFAIKLQRGER